MGQYSTFSEIYDYLMDTKDYDLWTENIIKIYNKYEFSPRKILELGCGTGNITTRLYKKGFSIIGTDISREMLEVANDKALEENLRIRFLLQDMTNLTFNKKVDSVISICDGINYITDIDKLKRTVNNIYDILNDNGLFLFDISTLYKLKNVIGNNVFHENFENFSYVWDNEFNIETRILKFELTLFLLEEENNYERFIENHVQRAHTIEEIVNILSEKFDILDILNESLNKPKENDERIYFVARKKGDNNGKQIYKSFK